ncbi:hypothetical protein YPPY113_1183, partial [Yersinia pestis PY-113]
LIKIFNVISINHINKIKKIIIFATFYNSSSRCLDAFSITMFGQQ